ncbi:hypothetical protein E1298_28695 [Actinomadura rubrisoli]|uniref:RHS repeat protein n=1 Tax=Actinomadura rubrisoli TaxID=2530368 RepID=A0A4R5AZK9_9ACTN|nr:hypothetical protein E1298_28695 [Actinomadura rubrisoli]
MTSTRNTYWSSPRTADGPGFHNAYMVRADSTVTRARKADGTYQVSQTDTSFDTEGRPVKAVDNGAPGDSGDDRCTTTTYADNTADGRWMLAFPETITLHEGACDGPAASKSVTLYDGAAEPGTANKPFDGNPTSVRTYRDANTYATAGATYDRFGRVTSTTFPNGTSATNDDTSTISYTPAEGWPTGGVTTTTPPPTVGAQPHVTKVFPGRGDGAPSKTLDANNNVTSLDYDAANRLIRVWGPAEPKPTNPSEAKPTVQFDYQTPQEGITPPSGATVVKTQRLQSGSTSNPNWLETWGYLDGFGRQVETQTRTPAGSETGRMISITRYDDRGLVAGTTGTPVYNADGPGRGLANTHWTAIPSWTTATYDGAERLTAATLYGAGSKKWSSTITPAADITVATPPSGGKRAALSDVRGRTTALIDDYQGPKPSTTRYGYSVRDELASITDAEGNITRQQYDWTG